ncbi:MAG: class I SAM-dependent methyltransferase, partial [Nocardioidaceae bacterium]
MAGIQGATARVVRLFDDLAADYDRSGVDFFMPIARRLVELLEVRPGERALDLGCGRGAVTFPLAAAVGEAGHVTAVDLSPAMVSLARSVAPANVEVACLDAAAPDLPERSYGVVASSLVLFFLPDPAA